MTVRGVSWACGHGTEMLLNPKIFQTWLLRISPRFTIRRNVPRFCKGSICGWNLFQPLGLCLRDLPCICRRPAACGCYRFAIGPKWVLVNTNHLCNICTASAQRRYKYYTNVLCLLGRIYINLQMKPRLISSYPRSALVYTSISRVKPALHSSIRGSNIADLTVSTRVNSYPRRWDGVFSPRTEPVGRGPWCSGYSSLLGKTEVVCSSPSLTFKIQRNIRSLVKIQYCGEPPWPSGSVLGLRPPRFAFRILCLEGSVISSISPYSRGSPGPI